ncbi:MULTISPECIES: 1-acyl-sn-glycerol-3-phosphate acyltransferase [Micromonospora]|uniref:1-acyl-sn-glycerol-3-phosphate acyltransferase n=1 Tax=Micromonospora solifontis TaxID=2487138 RepID=A0ABX9WEN7_9ACTN|nr:MULTISPECIES: lysophospholipid acyltransferase family protein [Micromonospora]NES16815.1 1-acyl-sn-glycerol-3-phosphate acyltransferase [Micromonospora sp. PPF5-17B]NES37833.1 1-acyl-sn-glycerol-3-phosphate acyltransferase [Micromonospora solifontis]NES58547.1 1-acyl-sn-glycerol-3-phosphate acyltransferase [Micromonospora sp. PPF5-6]RNL97930.1 1-acyl-sn-glycerol-3-phosphate acyltransferase [Micromonospora solifontis]
MPELVYPPVIAAARTMFRVLDLRLTVEGSHHVPRTGGAVMASNHVSYLDFIFCGYGALESRRLVRFMAKDSVFRHKVSGPLMRGMKHISVNRAAGAGSYATAVGALRRGEVVGVFPEATISRSFTVKGLKNGAARMAQEAAVPLLPVALWGTQRLWTKGRPRTLTRRHTPITVLVGEPMDPAAYPDANTMTAELRNRLAALVDRAQREYPEQPADADDAWWQPAHLGGAAPTPEEAAELDRSGRRAATS